MISQLPISLYHSYPRCCSRVCVDTTEVIETDHDKEVVSIENIEGEHDGVLCRIQVGNNVDVHGTDHHCDASQDQQETQLYVERREHAMDGK